MSNDSDYQTFLQQMNEWQERGKELTRHFEPLPEVREFWDNIQKQGEILRRLVNVPPAPVTVTRPDSPTTS